MLRVIKRKQVLEKIACSNTQLHNYINSGFFPAGIRESESMHPVWDEGVVDAWLIFRYGLDRELPPIGNKAIEVAKEHAERLKSTITA